MRTETARGEERGVSRHPSRCTARPGSRAPVRKTHTHSPRRSTPEASHPDPAGQMAPLHVEMSEMPGSSLARRTNQDAWSCWWVCGWAMSPADDERGEEGSGGGGRNRITRGSRHTGAYSRTFGYCHCLLLLTLPAPILSSDSGTGRAPSSGRLAFCLPISPHLGCLERVDRWSPFSRLPV